MLELFSFPPTAKVTHFKEVVDIRLWVEQFLIVIFLSALAAEDTVYQVCFEVNFDLENVSEENSEQIA